MTTSPKKRIAILGGGVGAMTTAFWLSEKDEFDITVYQLGWRLGGKGASGRNAAHGNRIEEHGLHIWCGMYDNAFRTIRRAYDLLDRPASAPLAKWTDAFKKHSFATVTEHFNGQWKEWSTNYPENTDIPGDGGVLPSPWAYLEMALESIIQTLEKHPDLHQAITTPTPNLNEHPEPSTVYSFWTKLVGSVEGLFTNTTDLHRARTLAKSLPSDSRKHSEEDHFHLLSLLSGFAETLKTGVSDLLLQNDDIRRAFMVIDFGRAAIHGVLKAGVLFDPESLFDRLDEYEFTDWLRQNGAHEITLKSPLLVGFYDFAFAFENGKPNFSAGAMLHAYARFLFTYKGALMWKMQAGMGDTIFTPVYEVLKKRGVRFEFFHRADHLALSADGKSIERIDFGIQATPKGGEYNPLVMVEGLPCWPSEPIYANIEQGDAIKLGPPPHDQPYNLESHWTSWKDVGRKSIVLGKDFDAVVLGISIAALPRICSELITAKPAWAKMVTNVKTTQTQAIQLWLNVDAQQLGWQHPQRAVLDAYVDPFNTWADMSQLLCRESWPAGNDPKNVAYFCGPLPDFATYPPTPNEAFVQEARDLVQSNAISWLTTNIGPIWPNAGQPSNPNALNWSLLYPPQPANDPSAFQTQYWRANIDPTERYVLSVTGSSKFRLRGWQSGFENLFLAGDWTYNGLNQGCVEAATTSGMQAAHAMCGLPETIVGEVPSGAPYFAS